MQVQFSAIWALYEEMVQGRQIVMFYSTIVLLANDCGYKGLQFWANPQKYQTLVPAKNSHLKVLMLHAGIGGPY